MILLALFQSKRLEFLFQLLGLLLLLLLLINLYYCVQTPDPRNIRSLSLTERPDVSVGILRHHSAAPLGQSLNIIYLP